MQFSAGHSYLTYQIKIGEWEAVLRRPPLEPVAPKPHDMEREFKIISEQYPVFSVTPKPILFSNREEIMVQTEDHKEGFAAFKEKRKPV